MQKEDNALVTNESNPNPDEILHIKCDVIQFIRDQISNIKGRKLPPKQPPKNEKIFNDKGTDQSVPGESDHSSPPCKPWGFIQWLLFYLLLILMFMYGAMIGANFCQTRRYGCHTWYPLAGFGRKGHDVVF